MSVEENQALIRRFNEEAWDGHSVEVRDRYIGPNFAISRTVVDLASNFTTSPDFHRTKDDIIAACSHEPNRRTRDVSRHSLSAGI